MHLSDILEPTSVKFASGLTSRKRLLQEMSDHFASEYNLEASEIFQALQNREDLGSTGVGNGIAIPHARSEQISSVVGLFYRLDKPIDYDAVDKQNVDLVFCLLAPKTAAAEHLRALALISRTLRNDAICEKLRANDSAGTLYTILTDVTKTEVA